MPLTRAAVRSTLTRSLHIPISPTASTVAVWPEGENGGMARGGTGLPPVGGPGSGPPASVCDGPVGALGGSLQAIVKTRATLARTLAAVLAFTSASPLLH